MLQCACLRAPMVACVLAALAGPTPSAALFPPGGQVRVVPPARAAAVLVRSALEGRRATPATRFPPCGSAPHGLPRPCGRLSAVAADSPRDVWAVGTTTNRGPFPQALVEHWNGRQWQVQVTPSPRPRATSTVLTGVAALSPRDVWAVGYSAGPSSSQPVVEHWNGTRWGIIPSPHKQGYVLRAVAAVTAQDVWAVGSYDAAAYCRQGTGPIIDHWEGRRWRVVAAPNIPDSASGNLQGAELAGMVAVSAHDIWAVGVIRIAHWDGTRWRLRASPRAPDGTMVDLAAVAALSAHDIWAVGEGNTGETALVHWDGRQWRLVPSPNTNT